MRRIAGGIGALFATLVIFLAGCGDQPTPFEPEAFSGVQRPFFSVVPAPGFDVLLRDKALKRDEVRSSVIGAKGGTIELKKAGVTLVIPRGALSTKTRITVTAPAGRAVAFIFAPHGLQFHKPAIIRVKTKGTNAEDLSSFDSLIGVYFAGDVGSGVTPLEIIETRIERNEIVLLIDHFSGYAIAGG